MKTLKIYLVSLLVLTMTAVGGVVAQTVDSVDAVDYDITLDLSGGNSYRGVAVVTLRMIEPCPSIRLHLLGSLDSLSVDGSAVSPADISAVPTAGIAVGDTFTVRVVYHGGANVESYGFGGFHFDGDMSYNLGVGFSTNPHVLGRAIMPCRDNLYDKATYTLRVKSRSGWSAECGGALQSRSVDTDGCEHSVWRIAQPVSTYLVSVSQAAYHRIEKTIAGHPFSIGFTDEDSTVVAQCIAQLDTVVPMFEQRFGPYRWGRIGYISTDRGSMEHVNNIALAYQAVSSMSKAGQSTMAHELGHSWFGNLITCTDECDMWIQEGGATFTEQVAKEATSGRAASDRTYLEGLDVVVRTAHLDDGGVYPLHGVPFSCTYGTTTYQKGGLVWHSLRGYLGDDLFYGCLRRLMNSCAYGDLDAYQLRDSMSLYSGMDLTDFFAFHVFGAGFVDYHVEMEPTGNGNEVRVTVDQAGVLTDNVARSNRLPITFFGAGGERHTVWLHFSGADTVVNVTPPFYPIFLVTDNEDAISDAATHDVYNIGYDTEFASDLTHTRMKASGIQQAAKVYVEHHYGHPRDIDTIAGVLRSANRYWMVTGDFYRLDAVEGRFRYSRDGYNMGEYKGLDAGFFSKAASLDSIVLMWRPDSHTPWRALTRRHSGGNAGKNEGYFRLDGLRRGEYTLAVVDSNLLSVSETVGSEMRMKLCPNPTPHGAELRVEVPTDEPFMLSIFDTAGRMVWRQDGVHTGQMVSTGLPAGTYLVRIENYFLSLQSKMIQL